MSSGRRRQAGGVHRAYHQSAWAFGFGTVKPLVRPPWLTDVATNDAVPDRRRGPRPTAASAPPRRRPRPGRSRRPLAERAAVPAARQHAGPGRASRTCSGAGTGSRHPPGRRRTPPGRRLSHARCSAVSDDEHVVSTGRLGRAGRGSTRRGWRSTTASRTASPGCRAAIRWSPEQVRLVVTPTKTPTRGHPAVRTAEPVRRVARVLERRAMRSAGTAAPAGPSARPRAARC